MLYIGKDYVALTGSPVSKLHSGQIIYMIEKKLNKNFDFLSKYKTLMESFDPMRPMGRVVQVAGMSIISDGPPDVSIGDICRVEKLDGDFIRCEVVGFQANRLILMPLGSITGVAPNSNVHAIGRQQEIYVSNDLLGRVMDGMGRPLDKKNPIISDQRRVADNDPPEATSRVPIHETLVTGVRAIDSLLTIGRGQRIGIFAGTGVGKSTLLGMIARYTKADINVICLVGERGREVRDFIEHDLGEEGLKRSVLFVATSDRSAMEKVYAAGFALSAAEFFRDQGKHVNLMMDSLTRYSMALREIGIASGDQLGPGGYPPAVWHKLSRLVERAGTTESGSITGFFTVLVEGDDMNDPVADSARGILDGHIVLSRRLAHKGHYPSIEITESISRVMDRIISPDHLDNARQLKSLLSTYLENEEIINLGAYARGSNPLLDEAIEKMPSINNHLKQRIEEGARFDESLQSLNDLVNVELEETYY